MTKSTNRIVISGNSNVSTSVTWYSNAQQVLAYFGSGPGAGPEYGDAQAFFQNAPAGTLLGVVRMDKGQRPHLGSANWNGIPLSYLQSIQGNLNITLDGFNYSANINLAGTQSLGDAAKTIQTALYNNTHLATLYNCTIVPKTITFQGDFAGGAAQLTETSGPPLVIGGVLGGNPNLSTVAGATQLIFGPPNRPADHYSTQAAAGNFSTPETMTETYGVLEDLGGYAGTLNVGDRLAAGSGGPLADSTAILQDLGGGDYVINNIPLAPVNDMNLFTTPKRMTVDAVQVSPTNQILEVQPGPQYGDNENASSIGFATGSAANSLLLTQVEGAWDSPTGGNNETTAQWASKIVRETNGNFGSFETSGLMDRFDPALEKWSLHAGNGREIYSSPTPW
jgi:hypothetical protein